MIYKLLITTVTISTTGNISTNQSIVEFENYSVANEAYNSIKSSDDVYVEIIDSDRIMSSKSKTTAIKLYQ